MDKSFARAVEELERLGQMPPPGRFRTDEMERALAALSDPHKAYNSVQVIGTNGKGSAAFFLSGIMGAHGVKTGLYTSPHLISFRERIVFAGKPISARAFAELYFDLRPLFLKFQLTQFERLTVLAAEHFRRGKAGFVVFETGLGGKGDAVSSFKSPTLLFTTISLEHRDILGGTIRLIAEAKAQPLAYCRKAYALLQTSRTAAAILKARANESGAELVFSSLPSSPELTRSGTAFIHRGRKYHIPMFGAQYAANAALALDAAAGILGKKFRADKAAGWLSGAVWQGRLQFLRFAGCNPLLVSCAHNDESLDADLGVIRDMLALGLLPKGRVRVLFGVSGNRDTKAFLAKVRGFFDDITVTAVPGHDSAFDRVGDVQGIARCRAYREAVRRLIGPKPEKKGFVLVIGSIYLAGAVLSALNGGAILAGTPSVRGGRKRG